MFASPFALALVCVSRYGIARVSLVADTSLSPSFSRFPSLTSSLGLPCFPTLIKAAAKKSSPTKKVKKPLSGFMLFSKENRSKVKEEDPDLTFGGVGKKLGEMWRALSDKEKEAYKSKKG